MTINMAAYQSPDSAHIQTGCTAYTLIYLLHNRIMGSLQATIVQQNHILLAVLLDPLTILLVHDRCRSVNEGHITGHLLAGTITR